MKEKQQGEQLSPIIALFPPKFRDNKTNNSKLWTNLSVVFDVTFIIVLASIY